MILRVQNNLQDLAPFTFLSQGEAVGVGTIHVQNASSFTANYAVQIGRTGEEKTELIKLNSSTPSGTQLVSSGTTIFPHATDTPVYAVKYDQVIWYRSTSGTSGAAVALATTSITPDSEFTYYDDVSGASTYAYKTAYYNSALPGTSSLSDWITSAGYDFYSLAAIRQRVKDKLFSSGYIGDNSVLNDWINEYLEQMTNAVIDVNQDYALGSTSVAFSGTAELGTITATDFKQIRRLWMYDGSNYIPASKMESTTPNNNQTYDATNPFFFMLGDNVISRWPHDAAGTATILYYKLNPVLANDTDTLPVPMRGYSKGFVDYALAMAYYKDGKGDLGQAKEGQAMAAIKQFQKESTPRTKTGPQFIDIIETVGEEFPDTFMRV